VENICTTLFVTCKLCTLCIVGFKKYNEMSLEYFWTESKPLFMAIVLAFTVMLSLDIVLFFMTVMLSSPCRNEVEGYTYFWHCVQYFGYVGIILLGCCCCTCFCASCLACLGEKDGVPKTSQNVHFSMNSRTKGISCKIEL